MTWIKENIEICILFIFVLLLLLLIIGVLTFIKSRKIYKQNNESQITMRADVEVSTLTSNVTLKIKLYNSSFKDVNLSQLGFVYKHQRIDFYNEACEFLKQDKLHIEARDYLSFNMNVEHFEEMIHIVAYKDKKIYPVRCFVIDTIGIEKITPSKALTKVLKERQKDRFDKIKEQNKEIKVAKKL